MCSLEYKTIQGDSSQILYCTIRNKLNIKDGLKQNHLISSKNINKEILLKTCQNFVNYVQ